MKKIISVILAVMMLISCFAGMSITANAASPKTKSGWVKGKDGSYQYYEKNEAVKGWKQIKGVWYYFDETTAIMASNEIVEDIDGKGDYAFAESGALISSGWGYLTEKVGNKTIKHWLYADSQGNLAQDEWKSVGGKWYYFDTDYFMISDTIVEIDEAKYCFAASGAMVTGWYFDEDAEVWYYAQSNGELVVNDWASIKGVWYHFDENGVMQVGEQVIDGETCYFSNSGAWVEAGWCFYDGVWHYIKDDELVDEWQFIDNTWYYFAECKMVTGGYRIDDVDYLFQGSGAWVKAPAKGWNLVTMKGIAKTGKVESCDVWYYINADGKFAEEWLQVGGKWYYFAPVASEAVVSTAPSSPTDDADPETGAVGMMYFNTTLDLRNTVFAFGADGAMASKAGWLQLKAVPSWLNAGFGYSEDVWAYVNDAYGVCVAGDWKTVNGKTYYFFEDGIMAADTVLKIEKKDGTHWYAFNASGAMYTSGWAKFVDEDGNAHWYYANAKGELAEGLTKISGKQYIFAFNGDEPEMLTKTTVTIGDKTYAVNEKGIATEVAEEA